MLKVIAQGFALHSNAYMRNPWNWIDFIVVTTGLIELLPIVNQLNISGLRSLRVLRPLRSITAYPSMKKLIQSMINAIPSLFGVVVFMGFILMNFAILANSQFAGAYYSRCRLTPEAVGDEWPYDPTNERLCSMDPSRGYQCPAGQVCGTPRMAGLPYSSDQINKLEYVDYGYTTFDNLFLSMLTIFQCITLEGWTKIMYNLMDQQDQTIVVPFFFISLVLIGGLFLINLVTAVFSFEMDKYNSIQAGKEELAHQQIEESLQRACRIRPAKESQELLA